MRRHAFRFVAIFLLLVAATLTLQELMPQWQLRLLPAASEFIPAFLVRKPPAPLPTQTAEAVFDNRDKGLGGAKPVKDVHRVFAKHVMKFDVFFKKFKQAVAAKKSFFFLEVKLRVINEIDN